MENEQAVQRVVKPVPYLTCAMTPNFATLEVFKLFAKFKFMTIVC